MYDFVFGTDFEPRWPKQFTMTRALGTFLVVIILILMFPLGIAIIGTVFGVMVGAIGGVFGAIIGVFGAIFGVIFGAIGAIFDGLFGWHWPFGFACNPLLFLTIIVVIALALRSRQKK